MNTTPHTPRILGLLIASLFVSNQSQANPPAANALPTGGAVTSGIGVISSIGNAMSITQGSQNLFTQFDSFNIGSSASVQFLQPSSSAIAVSRILGSDASQIFGRLSANGQLFLLNPHGVVFGPTAQVDVGGLVASSLKLSDKDILTGQYALSQGAGGGAVRNFGEIIARNGGLIALVAPQVENKGTIQATGGQIAMVAGDAVRLEIGQGGLIGLNVDGGVAQAQVDNSGSLLADGGKVWMTARQAGDLVGSAVNQTGVVRANTVSERNGEIWIDGGPQGKVVLDGQTLAMGTGASDTGGRISATAGEVLVKGQVNASAAKGKGYIEIGGGFQGKNARLANANKTTLENTAVVKANATVDGDGGTAVIWSEQRSSVAGVLEAKGAGAGKGGLVETSSRGMLGSTAKVDVSAESGKHGEWLLDPTTITIGMGGQTDTVGGQNIVNMVDATTISNALTGGANVTVFSSDAINIQADISKTGGAESTLTLTASGAINLGAPGVSRNISASNDPNTPTVTSSLNVTFNGGPTGAVTLFGNISTNGGDVLFEKPVNLASAAPISTTVDTPNETMPRNPALDQSGNITFKERVTLMGNNPVTLSTQSVLDGAQTPIARGGNIVFEKTLDSADINNPLGLTLNTTGAISLNGVPGNFSGAVEFWGNIGADMKPLRSIAIVGPSSIELGNPNGTTGDLVQTVTLRNNGGTLLSFDAPGAIRPALKLNNTNTVLNATGFGAAGVSDFTVSEFDIVKGDAAAVGTTDSNLRINSERSIVVTDSSIVGARTGDVLNPAKNYTMNVVLNSNSLGMAGTPASNSGSIALQGQTGSTIKTFGGSITLAGGSDGTGRAFGVAGQENTKGITLENSILDSSLVPNTLAPTTPGTPGNITLRGSAAVNSATAGAAVNLNGNTVINAGERDILVDAVVTTTSGSGAKDAVLIGEGGTAAVNILTAGAGNIRIVGDASAVDPNALSGASYSGVEISQGANIRTVDGDVLIVGLGGGGNNTNVGRNVGVSLKDDGTQINSQKGDITLVGQTGGKTTSYAVTTAGNNISLGQRRENNTARTPVTAEKFTGNVNLVGDTMKFVNDSTSRLRVTTERDMAAMNPLSTGQINIRSLHDVNIQIGGTEAVPPSSDNVATPDKPLFLASELFSGTNAVFFEGAGEVNIGQFGDAGLQQFSNVNLGTSEMVNETSKTISVAGATTVRDSLNLLARGGMSNGGGNIALNSNLTVQGSGGVSRTFNAEAAAGVSQATGSVLNAANVRVDAGNDVLLLGGNLIGTVAIKTDGNVSVNNAQALTVGTVARNLLGTADSTSGVTTQETAPATGRFLSVSANGANADVSITQALTNPGGLVNLAALGETIASGQLGNAVNQTGMGTINAADLVVRAQHNSDLTLTGNQFTRFAADMSTGGGDLSVVRGNTTNASITIDSLSIPGAASGSMTNTTINGVSASDTTGQVYVQNLNGGLTQTATAPVKVGGFAADVTAGLALNASTANEIDVLAALTSNGSIDVTNKTAMQVNLVNAQNNAPTPATIKTVVGVRSQGTAQTVSLSVTDPGAGLTVANVDNDSNVTIDNAVSGTGTVTLSTNTGAIETFGGVQAFGALADVAFNTAGGNISVGKTVLANRNVTATVSAGAGSITTGSTAPLTASNGLVALSTQSGAITTAAAITATGDVNTANSGRVTLNTVSGNISSGAAIQASQGNVELVAQNSGNINVLSSIIADNAGDTADVVLSTSSGSVSIGVASPTGNEGDLTASGQGKVRLRGSSIAQNTGSVITANALSAAAIGSGAGDVSLRGDNSFLTLAASSTAGNVHVKNTNVGGTNIGEVLGVSSNANTLSGLSAAGQISLNNAAGVTQDTGATGLVNARGGLYIDAAAGNVTLTNTLNQLDEVAIKANATNQQVALNSSTAVKLDTLSRTNLDGSTSSQAGISGNASSTQVSITTGAGLTQTAGAALVANAAVLNSTTATQLTDTANSVNTLTASSATDLAFVNNKSLSAGALSTGATSKLALQVEGNLGQTGALTAGSAAVVATGDVDLTNAGNAINQLAVKAANLNLRDTNGVELANLATVLPGANATVSGVQTQQFVLNTSGAVTQQANAAVQASQLEIRTQNGANGAGDVVLANRQNQIANLAAQLSGSADVFSASDLNLTTINGLVGVDATSNIQIRSAGNLTLQAANEVATTNGNIVLAADRAFTNQAGPNALQPDGGRWLIYDSNLTLEDRLGGLQPQFRRFVTTIDTYGPSQVLEAGNGYLTDAMVVNPNDAIRQGGSVGGASNAGASAQVPTAGLQELQNNAAVPQVYASINGAGLPDFPVSRAAFIDGTQTGARFDTPVMVQVNNRVPFSIALNTLVGAQQVRGITMVDGSVPPNWVKFDAENGVILGRVPNSQNEPFTLVVQTVLPNGDASNINVFINPTPLGEENN